VRIYLPATMSDLGRAVDASLAPRMVHAVTPALRRAFPDEDDEGLEFAAYLAAADDSFRLIAAVPASVHQRLVVTAEVPEAVVVGAAEADSPSLARLTTPVQWDQVICVHVDEPDAVADVDAALSGDEEALDRLSDRGLLWYDVSEVDGIPS
jgi:hypothetical protein